MNRLKLWLFALVVVAAAAFAVHVHTRTSSAGALRVIDAQVGRSAGIASGALAELSRDAAALAALAARDPALGHALRPASAPAAPAAPPRGRRARLAPPPAPPTAEPAADDAAADRAAAAALRSAEQALGSSDGPEILVASAESLERHLAGAGDAAPLLRAAAAGTPSRAHVRHDGRLWSAAAAPIGDGAAVLVLVPIDLAWARSLSAKVDADVIVVGPEAKTIATGAPADTSAVVKAAGAVPGIVSSVGRMASVDVGIPRAPKLPLLLVSVPAKRAVAVPLSGVRGALVVVSSATAPSLASLAVLQWWVLTGLVVLLVLALLFSLLVRQAEPAPMLPDSLLAAAARIEAGDLEVRAPKLAGKVGTVAAALNRALEAAAASPTPAPAPAAPAEDLFARAARPPEADPSAFDFPARPAAPAAEKAAPEPAPAAPEPAPARAAFEPAPGAIPTPPPPAAIAAPPELLQAAARAVSPSAADGDDEQSHWQQVFQDFVRTRAECGEPAEGLTFERFRAKLASNKATLVAKYGCRTVRFQVYVKEGKAALKATPVR